MLELVNKNVVHVYINPRTTRDSEGIFVGYFIQLKL